MPRLIQKGQRSKAPVSGSYNRQTAGGASYIYDDISANDQSDADLYDSAYEKVQELGIHQNRSMYLPSLQKKAQPEKEVVVDDIVIIGKNYLVNLFQFDSQEESIFKYNLEYLGNPRVVEVQPLPDLLQEKKFTRDYLLLDMRDPHEYVQCHIYDGKTILKSPQLPSHHDESGQIPSQTSSLGSRLSSEK